MELKTVFVGIASQMLADFDKIHSQIKHAGKRGTEREEGLRRFLEAYLPTRYAVSHGEIVDSNGETSRECDLVIYDSTRCPLLLSSEDYRVFPAEPVFAVVEVKSVLTKPELEDALTKINSVKKLGRANGPIVGVIFGYKSGKKKNAMAQIATQMAQWVSEHEGEAFADVIGVLDSGVICFYDDHGNPGIPDRSGDCDMQAIESTETPSLLWFFCHLLGLLGSQTSADPPYREYIRGGEIGFVTIYSVGKKKTDWFAVNLEHELMRRLHRKEWDHDPDSA